jgi:hypothetical protein
MLGDIVAYLHTRSHCENVRSSEEKALAFEKESPYQGVSNGRRNTEALVLRSDFLSVSMDLDSANAALADSQELVQCLAMKIAQRLYFEDNALEPTDRYDLRDANAATRKQYIDRAIAFAKGE